MGKQYLIIGENADDIYYYGSCERICPEAPVPVLKGPFDFYSNGGMAGNVANNIISLDPSATTYFYFQPEKIIKTRYVDKRSGYQVLRVDEDNHVESTDWNKFIEYLNGNNILFSGLSAVVISDYNKGFLSESVIKSIADNCYRENIPMFLDTKKVLGNWSHNVFIVKINESEYEMQKRFVKNPEVYCKNLIVTLGKRGTRWVNKGKEYPVKETRAVSNLAGCGDTHLSALAVSYVKDGDIGRAIHCANQAASLAASYPDIAKISDKQIEW